MIGSPPAASATSLSSAVKPVTFLCKSNLTHRTTNSDLWLFDPRLGKGKYGKANSILYSIEFQTAEGEMDSSN